MERYEIIFKIGWGSHKAGVCKTSPEVVSGYNHDVSSAILEHHQLTFDFLSGIHADDLGWVNGRGSYLSALEERTSEDNIKMRFLREVDEYRNGLRLGWLAIRRHPDFRPERGGGSCCQKRYRPFSEIDEPAIAIMPGRSIGRYESVPQGKLS